MTRRTWITEDGWDVACGWDRPLQHFFLDIGKECASCEGECVISGKVCETCKGHGDVWLFNNLANKKYRGTVGGMTLKEVMAELAEHLTQYPQTIQKDLLADKRVDMGNWVQDYGVIGNRKVRDVTLSAENST